MNAGAVFVQPENQTAPPTACLQAVRLLLKAQNVLKKHFQAAFFALRQPENLWRLGDGLGCSK
nr:hypothetical protein [uncultured Kingella sp.]